MKILFAAVTFVIAVQYTAAQNESIDSAKVEDFKIPATPGFALLDLSPSTIQKPSNPKAFAFTLLNFTGNGGALPKDFAVEVTPYWLVKLKNETFYKYMGLYDGEYHNTFSGLLRKLSFSISTHFNDSAKNFLPQTNYVSFGIKTNLLTIWGRKETEKVKNTLTELKAINKKIAETPGLTPQERADLMAEQHTKKGKLSSLGALRPAFQLDGAYATADMYADNKYENRKFFKKAFWLNASLSLPVNEEDYVYAVFYARLGEENILIDTASKKFNKQSNLDYGLKVEYEKGRFSAAFEHIRRKYKNKAELDGRRTVGILQYKVDNNINLFCTYGKNFSELNNLFTLFGLNWAFGSSPLLSKPK